MNITSTQSIINLSHKIELDPSNKQKSYFAKACGVSRHAWNWGLNRWNELYNEKIKLSKDERSSFKISGMALKKEYNSIKRAEFPWALEVTKYAAQQPFIQLQTAWNRFFNLKLDSKRPKLKKKNKCTDSFYIGGDKVKIKGKKIWIPCLGFVRLKEYLRFNGKINSVTVSRQADRWFASVQVSINDQPKTKKKLLGSIVGVDLGINKTVFLSDGTSMASPKPLKKYLKKLKKEQRRLSRKYEAFKSDNLKRSTDDKFKVSDRENLKKQSLKVQKIYMKIGNIRKDSIHKITNYITSNFKVIAIEDLHVKGMVKNQKLSRAISDIGFGEIRRQLEYKAKLRCCEIFVVDRFFPSSKTCSNCGKVKEKGELKLRYRVFECACGLKIDRDLNAAINLKNQADSSKKIRIVRPKFKPMEMMAMRKSVLPIVVTSVYEVGSKLQIG